MKSDLCKKSAWRGCWRNKGNVGNGMESVNDDTQPCKPIPWPAHKIYCSFDAWKDYQTNYLVEENIDEKGN